MYSHKIILLFIDKAIYLPSITIQNYCFICLGSIVIAKPNLNYTFKSLFTWTGNNNEVNSINKLLIHFQIDVKEEISLKSLKPTRKLP